MYCCLISQNSNFLYLFISPSFWGFGRGFGRARRINRSEEVIWSCGFLPQPFVFPKDHQSWSWASSYDNLWANIFIFFLQGNFPAGWPLLAWCGGSSGLQVLSRLWQVVLACDKAGCSVLGCDWLCSAWLYSWRLCWVVISLVQGEVVLSCAKADCTVVPRFADCTVKCYNEGGLLGSESVC